MPILWTFKVDIEDILIAMKQIRTGLTSKSGAMYINFNEALKKMREKLGRDFIRYRKLTSKIEFKGSDKHRKIFADELWLSQLYKAALAGGPAGLHRATGTIMGGVAPFEKMFSPFFKIERHFDHPNYNNTFWNSPLGRISSRVTNTSPGVYFVWTFFEYGVRKHPVYFPGRKNISGILVNRKTHIAYDIAKSKSIPAVAGMHTLDLFWRSQIKKKGIFLSHIHNALVSIFKRQTRIAKILNEISSELNK